MLYCLNPYFLWFMKMKINLFIWENHMLKLGCVFIIFYTACKSSQDVQVSGILFLGFSPTLGGTHQPDTHIENISLGN